MLKVEEDGKLEGGGGMGRVGNFGRGEANEVRCEWVLLGQGEMLAE